MRALADMEMSDDEKLDLMPGGEPEMPDYPAGLAFTLQIDDLEKFCAADCVPGEIIHFAAMGTATSINRDNDGCRIEVELNQMAGPDGQFVTLDMPPSICLGAPDLERLDLDEDCERGDTIHIVGAARVERMAQPRWGGDTVGLQIIHAAIEDESEGNRNG